MPDFTQFLGTLPYYLISAAIGYLAGSVPFGLVFTRLAGLGDVRDIGSGSIGATNVLRTGNKGLAVATLLADGAKGGLIYLLFLYLWGPDHAVIAGAAAFIGHIFPVWLKFKGGKGVATFLGIALAGAWQVGLAFIAIWLAMAALFRISSLSALVATLATPILFWVFQRYQLAEMSVLLVIIIWWAHRSNIQRLLKGKEPRIGAKSD